MTQCACRRCRYGATGNFQTAILPYWCRIAWRDRPLAAIVEAIGGGGCAAAPPVHRDARERARGHRNAQVRDARAAASGQARAGPPPPATGGRSTATSAPRLQPTRPPAALSAGCPSVQIHCPVSNNIPDWLMLTAEGRLEEAYEISSATNNMPEICGRICPQDRLCEGNCVIEKGLRVGDNRRRGALHHRTRRSRTAGSSRRSPGSNGRSRSGSSARGRAE